MNIDDGRLIERTLAGETNAFGELVRKYQDRLFGTLSQLLGSPHDARDVAQDAFLAAYEKLATFRREASFYSWLFRIAYNAAATHRRKNRRNRHASIEARRDISGAEPLDQRDETPSTHMEIAEDQKLVQQALDQLAPDFREILILKELEDMKYEEISDLLGIPLGTVRSRIYRARMDLKEILSRPPVSGSVASSANESSDAL
ncbi:MAG: sigma-70 family RNA polymerase sigma factor [Planctomycetaceae bacterium]|nr:sigma-70 family RNA polymerase sigma factor [Planctomycetaceae bacterium]